MKSRNQLLPFGIFRFVAAIILILTPLSGRAQTVEATIPIGNTPKAIAVNPVTQKLYIATCTPALKELKNASGEIAVIDGGTNIISQVTTGCSNAVGVAVNPVTNKIYLVDPVGDLTVIDGATNSTTTLNVPSVSPVSGSEFSSWSTNCTGTSACNIVMTSDQFVTATFSLPPSFSLQPASLSLTAQRGGR